jgi:hypothetical protein
VPASLDPVDLHELVVAVPATTTAISANAAFFTMGEPPR